ncbi:hypothetical protein FOYG_03900 [Fusarium oxysporum NRRL 32931]|uniref:Serine hydrolase domain-containing protein n=1 Tax=Fusarium oxysporum NRRL 32931 TaxID=660029 RepID=W9J325_FUSOX|nr:hypothetical protein FOYG_03900 [Fusarium oxysporum NRRL 32931]
MRFLCLHGYAFSVEVLQQQMEPITAHLPSDWEYEFLEAGMEPTDLMLPNLKQVPKPNYSWYNFPYPEDVEEAYERLAAYVESEGPFDGVWGFSQGGSMAALLLLMHQAEHPDTPYPFKMAIFTSAFLPHSFDNGVISWDLTEKNTLEPTYLPGRIDVSHGKKLDWKKDLHTSIEYDMINAVKDELDFPVDLLLRWRPSDIPEKIPVPSVHVRGLKDHYSFVDESVYELFDPEMARKMTHRGGHNFPRYNEELVHFAELIIETVVSLH